MSNQRQLDRQAQRLVTLLKAAELRIVFAESCTGGLVSASLTRVPGISPYLCGSAVVYRIDTKARWLKVSRQSLENPGPVSKVVAEQMAAGVLEKTPEADVAASITGHLGPDAPPRQDGLVYVGFARREGRSLKTIVKRHRLDAPAASLSTRQARVKRQMAAAEFVLRTVSELLSR